MYYFTYYLTEYFYKNFALNLKIKTKIINEKIDNILNRKFDINPKIYNKENVSCEYCKFRDICFKKDKDTKFLEKVEDLSFIKEGE